MTIVVCNYDTAVHKNLAIKHGKNVMIDNTLNGYGYTSHETIYDKNHGDIIMCFKDAVSVSKYIITHDIKEIYKLDECCELHLVPVGNDLSIESILYHAYNIITPQNSFLSRFLVKLLDDFDFDTDPNKKEKYLAKLNDIKTKCNQHQQKIICDVTKKFVTDEEIIRNGEYNE